MDKKILAELKEILEREKIMAEKSLEKFATKDEKNKGDWDTRFPRWGAESGGSDLERSADEVEEYSTLLPLEHSLEIKLRDVNYALDRIEKGKYGKCERCKKDIPIERLKISPEARFCVKCDKK